MHLIFDITADGLNMSCGTWPSCCSSDAPRTSPSLSLSCKEIIRYAGPNPIPKLQWSQGVANRILAASISIRLHPFGQCEGTHLSTWLLCHISVPKPAEPVQ
jgi:hypothetical protein